MSNPAMIGAQIYNALGDISGEIRQNNFSEIGRLKDSLQNALSRKQVIAGEESAEDYEERVEALESELAALEARGSRAVGVVEAPRAGYFIDSVDGLESVMEPDKVQNMTAVIPRQRSFWSSKAPGAPRRDPSGKSALISPGSWCASYRTMRW